MCSQLKSKLFLITLSLCLATSLYASTTISFFNGNNYQTGNEHANTLRFEQGTPWAYGDSFFFFDVTNPDKDKTGIYGEWQPRLSFSKITGHSLNFAFVSDVLLATEINMSGSGARAYLYGPGFNIKIPTFAFFKFNTYLRDDQSQMGHTYQISIAWLEPIKLSDKFQISFAGFADYAGNEGSKAVNFLAKPRIMLDIGKLFFHTKNKVYLGLQYTYWHNKLGIKGLDESVPEAMLSWKL